ncbi:unnamed protein product [Mytilus edulis]|uniref:Uncharacterized protein n=1 Tax=Mytilus edulis TaxID=6550 RepID=A0A8S3T2S7_MYTED|nr:unnamed protein product [Mytilus edulis]
MDLLSLKMLTIDGVNNVSFGSKFSILHNLSLKVTGLAARGTIQKDMFQHLPNIRFLDLSSRTVRRLGLCGFRNVTYDLPFTAIQIFKAQYLECERGGSSWLLTSDIKPLNETNLLELYIDGNNFDKAELTAKLFLPSSLRVLSVTDNRWVVDEYAHYHTLINLNSLTTFDASFQIKHQMLQTHNSVNCNHLESLNLCNVFSTECRMRRLLTYM